LGSLSIVIITFGDMVDGRIGQALEKVSGLIFANSTLIARGES